MTFTVGINKNGSNIDEVRLVTQECMENLCSIDYQNLSMNYSYSCCYDFYEVNLILTNQNASQIKYHLEISSNETWYKYDYDFINLGRIIYNTSGEEMKKTTSGFDILIVCVGIIFIIYLKRKT